MNLTIADIQKDIEEYQSRIAKAQAELDRLPTGFLEYSRYKAREKQRRSLLLEIAHNKQLCEYAREGISIRAKERNGGRKT